MTADAQTMWVVDLPLQLAARAAPLRRVVGLEVATIEERLWLKVPAGDDSLLRRLQAVADAPVLKTLRNNQLVPLHGNVPVSRLPQGTWISAATFFEPQLPVAGIPGGRVSRIRLQLIRSTHERPAELLLCNAADFVQWAVTAREKQLLGCRYALSGDDTLRVFVSGQRLPPLSGQLFWMAGQVAIPVGFEWCPNVDKETLNSVLLDSLPDQKNQRPIFVWQTSADTDRQALHQNAADCVQVIAASSLIRTTRSSVRNIQLPKSISRNSGSG